MRAADARSIPLAEQTMDIHLSKHEAALLASFRRLSARERSSLLDFADYLAARSAPLERAPAVPIARPHKETVVHAIRRLMRSYPQLDRARLLGETSRCLAAHMVDGREAAEVIDELEALFAKAAHKE
jgi:hypothetical protein